MCRQYEELLMVSISVLRNALGGSQAFDVA